MRICKWQQVPSDYGSLNILSVHIYTESNLNLVVSGYLRGGNLSGLGFPH